MQRAGQPHLPRSVTCPDRSNQPIIRAIGDAQCILFGIKRDHHLHRSKNLIACQQMVRCNIGKQRWCYISTLLRRVISQNALGGDLQIRAFRQEATHNLLLPRGNQRPKAQVVHRRSNSQPGIRVGHLVAHLIVDAPLHQDAGGGRTGLPGILNACVHQKGQRGVQIRIFKHQLRGFSAQLQCHWHHVSCSRRLHQRPGYNRPCKADMLDAGMPRQGCARLCPQPGHDVQRAIWQSGFLRKMGKGQRGQAGLFRWFQDTGIAHGQRGPNRPSDDLHGVVPWHDMSRHTMRLAQRVNRVAIQIGDCFTHHLVRRPTVEFAIPRQRHRICARLGQWLAHISSFQRGQVIHPFAHQLPKPGQDTATLQRGHPAPLPRPGCLCRGHGCVNILCFPARYLADRAAIRRVH